MAQPTCVKCGAKAFEMVEHTPAKSSFKYSFIQCAKCGSVVGVVDYFNIGELVQKLATALKVKL